MSSLSSSTVVVTVDKIQSTNWVGSIPIQITLGTSSISSPTIPPPLYCMVPRFSYLHIALQSIILKLYNYTIPSVIQSSTGIQEIIEPTTVTEVSTNDDDIIATKSNNSISGNIDGTTPTTTTTTSPDKGVSNAQPVKATGGTGEENNNKVPVVFPICWFEDEETRIPLRWQLFTGVLYDLMKSSSTLHNQSYLVQSSSKSTSTGPIPWKIKLHFTNYPSNQIIPFQDNTTTTNKGNNNNNNVIRNQIRQYYQHSIKQAITLQNGTSKPALNITKESHGYLWDSILTNNYNYFRYTDHCDFTRKRYDTIKRIPIRIYIDTKPPIQPSITDTTGKITLGDVLSEWLPLYFYKILENSTTVVQYRTTDDTIGWRICGIQPSLSCTVFELWRYLCHPDHFLYIVIVTR